MIKIINFAYSDKMEYQIYYGESKSYGLESLASIFEAAKFKKSLKLVKSHKFFRF